MRILMVTAEYAPLVKVGGLGDMVGSLAAALSARDHDVRVALPLYGDVDRRAHHVRPLRKYQPLPVRAGQRIVPTRVHLKGSGSAAVKVYLLEAADWSGQPGVYADAAGRPFADALTRLVWHAQAALALPMLLGWPPEVVHVHDAAAALAAVYRRRWYGNVPELAGAGTLLTIHNLAHQGIFPAASLNVTGLPASMAAYPGALEYHGSLNLLKAGIVEADLVNTVSPTYAREVVSDEALGCGLAGVLRRRGGDFAGILNGADLEAWNPARDPHLPARFSAGDPAGREVCREALRRETGLAPGEGPLAGFVGRLVEQKGPDLLLPLLDDLVAEGLRLIVLAAGEEKYRTLLAAAAARHPGRVAFVDRFDERLARRIYAGCDLFLMPSRFEPCGLAQMYALRYGAVPVVRATGGLADTVRDAAEADGDGFVFEAYTPAALREALARALALWPDREAWRRLQRRGMARLFGWDASAAAYEGLYARLAGAA